MKLFKQAALPFLFSICLLMLMSCERDAEQKKTTDYEKKAIPLTGAQETPATPTTALGSMDVFYSKETRVLNYTVNWSGLTGAVTGMHIHGLAPVGFAAPIVQGIIGPTSSSIVGTSSTLYGATSKFSGTLFVDGVVVRELDLLNGMYYINIHTAAYPGGEIRGQIVFQ